MPKHFVVKQKELQKNEFYFLDFLLSLFSSTVSCPFWFFKILLKMSILAHSLQKIESVYYFYFGMCIYQKELAIIVYHIPRKKAKDHFGTAEKFLSYGHFVKTYFLFCFSYFFSFCFCLCFWILPKLCRVIPCFLFSFIFVNLFFFCIERVISSYWPRAWVEINSLL